MKKGLKTGRWLVPAAMIVGLILSGEAVLCGYLEEKFSRMISEDLSEKLGTAVTVDAVRVDLWGRQAGVYGFRVRQPEGFGDGSLLHLPAVEATVSLSGLFSRKLALRRVVFADADIRLVADTNGIWNVQTLADRLPRGQRKRDGFFQSIRIDALNGSDCRFRTYEPVDSSNAVTFAVADLDMQMKDFRYNTIRPEPAAPNGSLRLTGRIRKTAFPDGRCGVAATFGPFGAELPAMNASLRIIGLELAVLAPVLMDHAASILGGDAVDLSADLQRRSAGIDGTISLETIAGYRYEAVVAGTLHNPALQIKDDALSLVLGRSGGLLGRAYGNLRSAGEEAFAEGRGAAAELIKETSKSAESFGTGFLNAVQGAVTLDLSDINKGVREMGVSVAGGTKDAVFTAGGGIMEGVGSVTGSLTGDADARAWRSSIPRRWEQAWQDALDTVELSRGTGVSGQR